MIQLQIAALEQGIETKKHQVALNNALERLMSNKDFKKVVLDGYFTGEAVRLVSLKADYSQRAPDAQAAIIRDIDAIGSLQKYFRLIETTAEQAASSIKDDEQTVEELNAEALEAKGEK